MWLAYKLIRRRGNRWKNIIFILLWLLLMIFNNTPILIDFNIINADGKLFAWTISIFRNRYVFRIQNHFLLLACEDIVAINTVFVLFDCFADWFIIVYCIWFINLIIITIFELIAVCCFVSLWNLMGLLVFSDVILDFFIIKNLNFLV